MWMELKAVITVVACIFLGVVIAFILSTGDMLLTVLCFFSMGLMIFGDIILGYMITTTNAKMLMDKPPQGWTTGAVFSLTGMLDFVWAKKGPHGKREFVYNKEEASIIDKGDYPIHFRNGAVGFVAHESCDENLNMFKVKYAEKLGKQAGTNEIMEIYNKIKELESDAT